MEKALRYNNSKPKWDLLHYHSLIPMIRVLEFGAHKYSVFVDSTGNTIKGSEITPEYARSLQIKRSGKDNWKGVMDLREILSSMQRHLAALMDGESEDPESGISHIGHIMCNCMFYQYHLNNEFEIESFVDADILKVVCIDNENPESQI